MATTVYCKGGVNEVNDVDGDLEQEKRCVFELRCTQVLTRHSFFHTCWNVLCETVLTDFAVSFHGHCPSIPVSP